MINKHPYDELSINDNTHIRVFDKKYPTMWFSYDYVSMRPRKGTIRCKDLLISYKTFLP
jgi:hypothetical protein